jgi:hypothetical protein
VKLHRYASLVGAVALVLSSSALAFASTSPTESTQTTECATAVVSPGSLTATSTNFAAGTPITLDGQVQNGTLTGTGSVVDNTGLGMGWTLTEGGTPLTLEMLYSPEENNAGLGTYALPTSVSVSNPNPSTGTTVGAAVNLPGSGVVLSTSAGNGMGTTTFDETLNYSVPANAYAGTYDATITVQADENLPASPNNQTNSSYSCTNGAAGSSSSSGD